MKNIFSIVVVTLLIAACNQSDTKSNAAANNTTVNRDSALADSANFTTIQWLDSIQQELGKVTEGQTPEITWKFKNTGTKPLIVINASGTCGCTIAEKPEQPVAPGEEGVIKAKFNSEGRVGPNFKQVIVTTNTKGNSTQTLSFKVEVEKK